MNKKKPLIALDDYTVFRLLCELAKGEAQSQRELSRRLNSALGLVNGYLKVCSDKGWVKVREQAANRSSYHLTPKGVQEQRRLAIQHARYLGEMLEVVRQEYCQIAHQLADEGVERVALCGVDGIADLVRSILQEQSIEVSMVMDTTALGTRCAGREVVSLAHAMLAGVHQTVISSISRATTLYQALRELGTDPQTIKVPQIFMEQEQ